MPPSPEAPSGVIHDLGYRGYDGPRLGLGAIAGSLYLTGLRNAFGLGRSGKSKVLPFLLLALTMIPAVILVGVLVLTGLDKLPIAYSGYADSTQILLSIFAAAQAPVLFSRDLRHGSIVLYLARPLEPAVLAVVRWASLASALFLFVMAPVVVLLVGALLAKLDVTDQLRDFGAAVLMSALLASMVAGLTGLISSWSVRRGFAVVGSIALLIVGSGVAQSLQFIAVENDADATARFAGLLSPFTIYVGGAHVLDDSVDTVIDADGPLWSALYLAAPVLVTLVCLALLVLRFRKVAAR